LRDDSIDPLRGIYTEIIQPLVGNFFDVDAVLSSDEIFHDEQFYEVDNPYLHTITPNSAKHTHTKSFHRPGHGRTRSKG